MLAKLSETTHACKVLHKLKQEKKHLMILLEHLEYVFAIWPGNFNLNCSEASKHDFTESSIYLDIVLLIHFGACSFVQDVRNWGAEKLKAEEEVEMANNPKLQPWLPKYTNEAMGSLMLLWYVFYLRPRCEKSESENWSEIVLYSINLQPNWHFNRRSPWISR